MSKGFSNWSTANYFENLNQIWPSGTTGRSIVFAGVNSSVSKAGCVIYFGNSDTNKFTDAVWLRFNTVHRPGWQSESGNAEAPVQPAGNMICGGYSYNPNNRHICFYNGSQTAADTFFTNMSYSAPRNRIGVNGSSAPGDSFGGAIYWIAMWKTVPNYPSALVDSGSASIMAGAHPLTVWRDDIAHYWPLRNTASESAKDVVGGEHMGVNGTLVEEEYEPTTRNGFAQG